VLFVIFILQPWAIFGLTTVVRDGIQGIRRDLRQDSADSVGDASTTTCSKRRFKEFVELAAGKSAHDIEKLKVCIYCW
jgi:hypothetical protein